MILLGTHNSLSYFPCQWYLRPFAWIGKCQSLNLAEQYQKGVRYFDVRVKYVNDKAVSGHGLLTYAINIEIPLMFLNNRKEQCIVRLFLENSYFNPTKHFERFAKDIKVWKDKYKNIRFIEGGCRFVYKQFIEDKVPANHYYWSKGDTLIPYPRWYAKRNNAKYHVKDNKKEYNIYDFIEF